jgi:glycogen debranching enzyme
MKKTSILIIAILFIVLPENIILADKAGANTRAKQKLAQTILNNPDLELVLKKAHKLLSSGLRAGTGYNEVWIRDLNTFIELALDVQKQQDLRQALLLFFHFQGADGNIVDGYVPKEQARVNYKYIKSKSVSEYLAHKNTVETDQESSLVQAVHKYVKKTDDKSFLKEIVNDISVLDRMERAMQFLLENRFNGKYGLIWGATTSDWGDVQPEHSWGVVIDDKTHYAIDIYDNAMFVIAIDNFLDLAGAKHPRYKQWRNRAKKLQTNVMKHLWIQKQHKFRPHIYLKDSPFPKDFDENRIYYHGGTAVAIEADLLTPNQIKRACNDMIKNKQSAGAGTIGLTVYPPYPKGFFANPSMGPWSYQNGGDWTWFGGRMIQQLIHYGFVEEAWQEMRPMVERVKKNNGFYEWYSVDNKPRGSGQFRGSAGVLGKAIVMIQQWAKLHKN